MSGERDWLAQGIVRWKSPSEGGRNLPPSGPIFGATARFPDQAVDDAFSIVLGFARNEGEASEHDALIDVLARDLVGRRFREGVTLSVLEGPRAVAELVVTEVFQ